MNDGTKATRGDSKSAKLTTSKSLILGLGGSFFLFTGGFVLDQAFRWSDPLQGMLNGILHIPLLGIGWFFSIYGLISTLLIYVLYRWRGWKRFRTLSLLAPAFPVLFLTITDLIRNPTTPASRLKQYAGADFPPTAREIRTDFTGGGICDYGDNYAFRCSAEDTEKLIGALKLRRDESYRPMGTFHLPAPDWPDPSTWGETTTYRGGTKDEVWRFELTTDSTRERVYIHIWSI